MARIDRDPAGIFVSAQQRTQINTFDGYEFNRQQFLQNTALLNDNDITVAVFLQGQFRRPQNPSPVETFTFQSTNSRGNGGIFTNGFQNPAERYFISAATPNSLLCQLNMRGLTRRTLTVGSTIWDHQNGTPTNVTITC